MGAIQWGGGQQQPVNNGGYDPSVAAAMQQQLFAQYRPQTAASVINQANVAEAQLPAYLQINPLIGSTEYNQAKNQYMNDVVGTNIQQQSANDNANGVGNSSFAAQRGAFLKAEGARNAEAVGLQAKQAAQQLQLAQRQSYYGGAPNLVPNISPGQYQSNYSNFLTNQQQLGTQYNQDNQNSKGSRLGSSINAGLGAFGGALNLAGF